MTDLKSAMLFSTIFVLSALLTGSAPAAPDNTPGMALMSATVAADGTLVGGSGVASVTRTPSGIYDVTFDRDLSNCTCTASFGKHNDSITFGASSITANCPYGANETARVMTVLGNSSADLPFQMIVFCPK